MLRQTYEGNDRATNLNEDAKIFGAGCFEGGLSCSRNDIMGTEEGEDLMRVSTFGQEQKHTQVINNKTEEMIITDSHQVLIIHSEKSD